MSFWSTPGFADVSDLCELIDSGNAKLEQVLDEPLARQDMRAGQQKLVDFLKKDENIVKLLQLALSEPEIGDNVDRQTQFSKQKIATDLLTIGGYLAEPTLMNDSCVKILDEFIQCHPSTSDGKGWINPLTMSFYITIMTTLFNTSFAKSLNIFGNGDKGREYLANMIDNIGYSCVRDIPVRLVTLPETQEDGDKLRKWFCGAKIGVRLSDILARTQHCTCMCQIGTTVMMQSSYIHNRMANVEQTWVDMVKGIRDVTPSDSPDAEIDDDLLKHLSTSESIDNLVRKTLCVDSKMLTCEKSIEHSCNILILLLRAHHFPKCPSNLALLALSSDRGKWVPTAQLATQELQGKAADLDTAANEFNATRIGLADRIDDSHMPINEEQATARQEVEYILTKHLPSITKMMKQNKSINVQARSILVKLLTALINNDYAPAHGALHESKILVDLLPLLFDDENISYSIEQQVLREFLQTLLFSRPPITPVTPASGKASEKVIAISNPQDILGLQSYEKEEQTAVRQVGNSPLIVQALVDSKLITSLITVGRQLTEGSSEQPRDKARGELKNFALLGNTMQLVRVVENARLRGPNRLLVESTLQKSGLHQEWLKFVQEIYVPYRERTQPDEVSNQKYDSVIDFNAIRLDAPGLASENSTDNDITIELNKIFQTAIEKTTRIKTISDNDCGSPQKSQKPINEKPKLLTSIRPSTKVPDRVDIDSMFESDLPSVESGSIEIASPGDVYKHNKRIHPMKTRSQKSDSDDADFGVSSSSDEQSSAFAEQQPATVVDSHFLQQRHRQYSGNAMQNHDGISSKHSAPFPVTQNDSWADFGQFQSAIGATANEPDWVSSLTASALEQQCVPDDWVKGGGASPQVTSTSSDFAMGFAAGIISNSSDIFSAIPTSSVAPSSTPLNDPLPQPPPVPKRKDK